ncbi:aminotransferase class IV family protein [Rhizobium sp. KVB221]|uniref:Probable branched-chain-amino-acid aminotransferase n=1 Tax=Rhizobium setariae TaxID=2801340 RepID=A0A937CQK2_9HYPH|nr:aminotransferase class IV family protein [Rhizobium setariae]MBL0374604.1 aminotransferase class IV family protein [Rhizobium setariae]
MINFSLIETMRYEPGQGIVRLNLHMARLGNSTRKLGFAGFDQARSGLEATVASLAETCRIRLELFRDGRCEIVTSPFAPLPEDTVWAVGVAKSAHLSSSEPLLRHKTSERQAYEQARSEYSRQECDEVLLLNEKDEICEGTITNVFVDAGGGKLLTPALSSGCLAGVLRTSLICAKKATVERITPDMLERYPFYLGNSLRGLIRGTLLTRR